MGGMGSLAKFSAKKNARSSYHDNRNRADHKHYGHYASVSVTP